MIPARRVFDESAVDYDRWFDDHGGVFAAQVRLLRDAVPHTGRGLDVGTGSGRFAVPLGLRYGIDPSRRLAEMAQARGIEVVLGEGEHLPYRNDTFDYVLMMTVICFLDGPAEAIREAFRVLVPGGDLILGFIEKDGETAARYLKEKTRGRFLQYARFRTVDEVARLLEDAGFAEVPVTRTKRGFCVMAGRKQNP